jgi:hypothetical protein
MGLTNVQVMVPFVRTVNEARQVVELLAANGLKRGENGLKIIMMCELPTNALLADKYLEYFDGMSIGSNDMTQLTLGLDRDSGIVAKLFDERDEAVKALLSMAITACKRQGKYVGICGQGPSDHPDLARWLVDQGISSVSLNPDSVVRPGCSGGDRATDMAISVGQALNRCTYQSEAGLNRPGVDLHHAHHLCSDRTGVTAETLGLACCRSLKGYSFGL